MTRAIASITVHRTMFSGDNVESRPQKSVNIMKKIKINLQEMTIYRTHEPNVVTLTTGLRPV